MPFQPTPPMSQPVQEITGGTMDRVWYRFLQSIIQSGLNTASVPATSSSPGSANQVAFDNSFLYICIAPNTWLRVAISSW